MNPGEAVRRSGNGAVGVVLEVYDAGQARVAFGTTIEYVAIDDLLPAEPAAHSLLAQGEIGDPEAAYLRLLASLLEHSYRYDPGSSLSNARLEPKLHQVFVAHRVVTQKVTPRMILADEVGLGKTIEAGLIIKELKAREAAERVLVMCPASLTRQWQSELSTKFNERFEIIDGAAAKHYGRGGKNPFTRVDNVICSLPFAVQAKRAEQIVDADWDVVVFDEAHRVRRTGTSDKARTTLAYRLADDLRDHVHGLLLLSATPVQLHAFELYSLIDLVEPGLFRSYQHFDRERQRIPGLNEVMLALQNWPTYDGTRQTQVWGQHQSLLQGIGVSEPGLLDDDQVRETAKNELVGHHPLANVMVRNRKAELGMAGKRTAFLRPVRQSDLEREIYAAVSGYLREGYHLATAQKNNAVGFLMVIYQKMLTSTSHALRVSFRRRIAKLERAREEVKRSRTPKAALLDLEDPDEQSSAAEDVEALVLEEARLEVEIDLLRALANQLDEVRDTKIAELVKLLEELVKVPDDKVVVFTQFIETQNFLATTLEHNGFKVSVFNGRMSADEKELAIRAFRDHAQVLVSTEAGGEGRNLQFANMLVNFDLPWNPMKVEQRIGRLDRIGQCRPVEVYNLVYEDTLEERIVEVLQDRIRLFEESVGSLDPILGAVEKDIERLAMSSADDKLDAAFDRYGENLEQRVAEARLKERTLADFVLDRASLRRDEASKLLGEQQTARPGDLERFVGRALDRLGGSVVPHEEGGHVITLSPRLANRLGVRPPVQHGLFDPLQAVSQDDLDFFACGHPLIDKLLNAATEVPGSFTGARRSADVPPGLWVEVIWRVRADMIVQEGQLIRHLVGPDCHVASTKVDRLPLDDEPVRLDVPSWVDDAVDASERRFRSEFDEKRVELMKRFEHIRQERLDRHDRVYESQRGRLQAHIEQAEAWISEKELVGASERERRVLPARKGRLKKDRERLARLAEEQAAGREQIERQEPTIGGDVVSAFLVEGVGART